MAVHGPRVVGSEPADGELSGPRRGPFRIFFSRRLQPASVNRSTVRLESGRISTLLELRFDPIDRAVVAFPFARAPLEPNVFYRLTVHGVENLEGRAMSETHVIAFKTGRDPAPVPPDRNMRWETVAPIFERHCASAVACHGPTGPALGLDLSSASAARRTAIGVASRQVANQTVGAEGTPPRNGLSGMRIVDAFAIGGRPETSYLIYKMLDDPHILGAKMPPSADVTRDDLRLVAEWIEAGAPTGDGL